MVPQRRPRRQVMASLAFATAPDSPAKAAPAAVARLTGVTKTYDDGGLKVTAVNGISLAIPARRFAMIVGPSGSGKTTLLNLIGCIDRATTGSVEVCGQPV